MKHRWSLTPQSIDIPRTCQGCGATFHTRETRPDQAKYCQHSCYVASTRPGPGPSTPWASHITYRTCLQCGNPFTMKATSTRRKAYCTPACRYQRRLDQAHAWYWYTQTIAPGGAGRHWRDALLWWLRQRDGDICHLCQDTQGPIQWDLPSGPLGHPSGLGPSIDHVIPQSKGGTDHPDNLKLAHWRCNHNRFAGALPAIQLVLT